MNRRSRPLSQGRPVSECLPNMSALSRLLILPLLLACALPVAAQPACPVGQERVCVGFCFCAPSDSPLVTGVDQVAAPALRDWILESRHRALQAGSEPIPLHIRAQLEPYFDLRVLDTVRYRIGDPNQGNLSYGLLQNPDISAVTLIDLVIFQSADEAENDVALWAHELLHVQQYLELGVDGFAARYVRDSASLESPAYQLQSRVRQALKTASR